MYTGAVAIYTFPGGTGAIHLDDLRCTGSESRLIDCPHSGAGVHNCSHSEDAGVRCVRPRMLCCYDYLAQLNHPYNNMLLHYAL